MRKLIFIFLSLLFSLSSVSQETEFQTYSFSEFFQMIEKEDDTVFTLENALIDFDTLTDQRFSARRQIGSRDERIFEYTDADTIYIDKEFRLNNVFFALSFSQTDGQHFYTILHQISFQKKVVLTNCLGRFGNNTFEDYLEIKFDDNIQQEVLNNLEIDYGFLLEIFNSSIMNGISTVCRYAGETELELYLLNNRIYSHEGSEYIMDGDLWGTGLYQLWVQGNEFLGEGDFTYALEKGNVVDFQKNDFGDWNVLIRIASAAEIPLIYLRDNKFTKPVMLDLVYLVQPNVIDFQQFKNGIISQLGIVFYPFEETRNPDVPVDYDIIRRSKREEYLANLHTDSNSFKEESKLLGLLHGHYKQQHDTEYANAAYIKLKDLETKRMAYLFQQNPGFDSFFQWKINQFLKAFSNYGTKPSKAIVMSVYVVLFFALIYLFFPNSWDKHGKYRIVNRYAFFTKYMRKDAGIHEVYQEAKKPELLTFDQFRELMKSSEHEIPGFFTATALPLYRWAVSGTRLSAAFLKRIDIMRGTWSELPQGKKWWKGILLIGAFTIAIIYDMIIKMLNALMLSINTFSTLGFGEIPIKGLPRYLAIIQGFIGWFMLTIFSVSLISQLLN